MSGFSCIPFCAVPFFFSSYSVTSLGPPALFNAWCLYFLVPFTFRAVFIFPVVSFSHTPWSSRCPVSSVARESSLEPTPRYLVVTPGGHRTREAVGRRASDMRLCNATYNSHSSRLSRAAGRGNGNGETRGGNVVQLIFALYLPIFRSVSMG